MRIQPTRFDYFDRPLPFSSNATLACLLDIAEFVPYGLWPDDPLSLPGKKPLRGFAYRYFGEPWLTVIERGRYREVELVVGAFPTSTTFRFSSEAALVAAVRSRIAAEKRKTKSAFEARADKSMPIGFWKFDSAVKS